MTPATEGAPRPSLDARHASAEDPTQPETASITERAHAQSRHEADVEGIKLCALMIAAFGYPFVAPLASGRPLDPAAITCGLVACSAALLLLREAFERARAWSSQT